MRFVSILVRAAIGSAILAALAACGSGGGNPAPSGQTQPQSVTGVQTPSQISVVTAK